MVVPGALLAAIVVLYPNLELSWWLCHSNPHCMSRPINIPLAPSGPSNLASSFAESKFGKPRIDIIAAEDRPFMKSLRSVTVTPKAVATECVTLPFIKQSKSSGVNPTRSDKLQLFGTHRSSLRNPIMPTLDS
jgi:hypothetical protein